MKMFFFCQAVLPSPHKQARSAMAISQAFVDLKKDNSLTLFFQRDKEISDSEIFSFYQAKSIFSLVSAKASKIAFLNFIAKISGYNWHIAEQNKKPDFVYSQDIQALRWCALENVPMFFEIDAPLKFFEKMSFKKISRLRNFYGVVVYSDKARSYVEKNFSLPKKKVFFISPNKNPEQIAGVIFDITKENR